MIPFMTGACKGHVDHVCWDCANEVEITTINYCINCMHRKKEYYHLPSMLGTKCNFVKYKACDD